MPSADHSRARDDRQGSGGRRVIIVGAGLSGLVAGYELVQRGFEVTLLEAQRRVGGRVHTLRFAGGLHAEAGATFIPGDHGLTLRYARRFGLRLISLSGRAQAYFVGGRHVDLGHGAARDWPPGMPEEWRLGPRGLVQKYLRPVLDRLGPLDTPEPPPSWQRYDAMTLAALLRKQGASPDAIALLRLTPIEAWGDGIETCSALAILRDLALGMAAPRTYAIEGGNDLLPQAFAARLVRRIRQGVAVVGIEHDPEAVRVLVQSGQGTETLHGDHLICAIPLPLLEKLAVSPAFTRERQRAVQELGSTSVTRVYLQVRERFWVEQGQSGSVNTDLPIMRVRNCTFGQPGPEGILECYMVGPAARRVGAMGEPERIAFTLAEVEKVYPSVRRYVETGASWSWDDDEWARGAYLWPKPGHMSLLPHVTAPEGRVHFAGDHTSPWPGWMQGALDSGLRVVEEISRSLSSPSARPSTMEGAPSW